MPSVLITGAGRGIGLALAKQYGDAGWRVFACYRQMSEELEAIVNRDVTLCPLDVSDDSQISRLVDVMEGEPLDVLFNNAGVYGPAKDQFGNLETQPYLSTLHINAVAPLLLAQGLLPNLQAGSRKVIASLSSRMGSIADNRSGGHYPYRASKAALNAGLKSLSIDLGPKGIKVLIFHPGWVKTDMGGPNGELTTAQSVAQLRRLIDEAHPRDSGRFINVDGSTLPW